MTYEELRTRLLWWGNFHPKEPATITEIVDEIIRRAERGGRREQLAPVINMLVRFVEESV